MFGVASTVCPRKVRTGSRALSTRLRNQSSMAWRTWPLISKKPGLSLVLPGSGVGVACDVGSGARLGPRVIPLHPGVAPSGGEGWLIGGVGVAGTEGDGTGNGLSCCAVAVRGATATAQANATAAMRSATPKVRRRVTVAPYPPTTEPRMLTSTGASAASAYPTAADLRALLAFSTSPGSPPAMTYRTPAMVRNRVASAARMPTSHVRSDSITLPSVGAGAASTG